MSALILDFLCEFFSSFSNIVTTSLSFARTTISCSRESAIIPLFPPKRSLCLPSPPFFRLGFFCIFLLISHIYGEFNIVGKFKDLAPLRLCMEAENYSDFQLIYHFVVRFFSHFSHSLCVSHFSRLSRQRKRVWNLMSSFIIAFDTLNLLILFMCETRCNLQSATIAARNFTDN